MKTILELFDEICALGRPVEEMTRDEFMSLVDAAYEPEPWEAHANVLPFDADPAMAKLLLGIKREMQS